MQNQKKIIVHNGISYEYELDNHGYIWIIQGNTKTNVGQIRPITFLENIEDLVHQMLNGAGY